MQNRYMNYGRGCEVYTCAWRKAALLKKRLNHRVANGEQMFTGAREYIMIVVDKLGEMDVTICKDSLNAMLLSDDTHAIRVRISPDAIGD